MTPSQGIYPTGSLGWGSGEVSSRSCREGANELAPRLLPWLVHPCPFSQG